MPFDRDVMLLDLFIIYIQTACGNYLVGFLDSKSARPKGSFEDLDYFIFILKSYTCCSTVLGLFGNYTQ